VNTLEPVYDGFQESTLGWLQKHVFEVHYRASVDHGLDYVKCDIVKLIGCTNSGLGWHVLVIERVLLDVVSVVVARQLFPSSNGKRSQTI
jgi:hypothetical protein